MDPSKRSKMGFTPIDIGSDEGISHEKAIRMLTVRHLSCDDLDDDGKPWKEAVGAWEGMCPLLEGEQTIDAAVGQYDFVIMMDATDDPNHQLPLFAGHIRYLPENDGDWPIYGRLCGKNKVVWKQLKSDRIKSFWGEIDWSNQSITGCLGDAPGFPEGRFTLRKRDGPMED